ncbi:MAG: pyocin activator PrtN family protein [Gammaproteobacteria bacterium]
MTNSSTFFALMAEYGTGDIPLEQCCEKYFGMSLKKASTHARHQQLPIPAYRGGSQKSMWLVSAVDLANHIDLLKEKAKHDWQRLNS